jgi:cell division initiation protein
MLTPQEVSSHAFPKAMMGGYNMSSVDEFLDEVTDDYTALYKENAALKAKMKVLVEKVEDYRATEDSMRATLLTAQKMADSIVKEAEAKRDEMLSRAESDAMAKIGELQREYLALQERMKAGHKELEEFISSARAVCAQQMAYLDELPRLSVEDQLPPEEPAAPEPAAEIEENLFSSFARENEARQPEAETTAEPEPEPEPEEDPAEEDDYPEGNPFEPEDNEPTRRINLSQLKFGRNYTGRDDD